ncbi:hypothetical protein [Methylomonas koyamae]|uniref:hypothetical protein n=1 Tax=Methylomonas koyamae TaxID=702114 RepID=UPI0012F69AE9|nr:hypothetical protein [Methylomonas koyamae]
MTYTEASIVVVSIELLPQQGNDDTQTGQNGNHHDPAFGTTLDHGFTAGKGGIDGFCNGGVSRLA